MLTATLSTRTEIVEAARALLAGKTVRLPLDWPKTKRGEHPIEIGAPGLEEPLRLLATRAGGRVTAAGLRVRAKPADEVAAELLAALAADEPEEEEAGRDSSPNISVHPASVIPPELDPDALEDAARQLLTTTGEIEDFEELLLVAEEEGAAALCRARLTTSTDPLGRSHFFATMRDLGRDVLPAIEASLDPALQAAAQSDDTSAIEDLLRAIPDFEHEALARSVARLLTYPSSSVQRAAVSALPRLCGERAKPDLRVALRSEDEAVCRAAISGLRRVGGIDRIALHRLDAIVSGDLSVSDELRAIAASALVDVEASQRPAALDTLRAALNPRTSMVDIFLKADDADPQLVESICRTMLVIGDRKDRRSVAKKASRCSPQLRQRLEALLERL